MGAARGGVAVLWLLCVVACFLLLPVSGAAQEADSTSDWNAIAAPRVVEILTTDADGDLRKTKIWIVLLEGRAYIRTMNTRWYANLERDPSARIHSEGREVPIRVEAVTDAELKRRVEGRFRSKYGLSDRLRGLVVFGEPNIMRALSG